MMVNLATPSRTGSPVRSLFVLLIAFLATGGFAGIPQQASAGTTAPRFAGATIVTALGSKSAIFELSKTIQVDYRDIPSWVTLSSSGRYVGFVLEAFPLNPDWKRAQRIVFVRILSPSGCPTVSNSTMAGPCRKLEQSIWNVATDNPSQGPPRFMTLKRGRYVVAAIADSDATSSLTFHFSQLPGRTIAKALRPLRQPHFFAQRIVSETGGPLTLSGRHASSLHGPGVLMADVWSSPAFHTPIDPIDHVTVWGQLGSYCWARAATSTDPWNKCGDPVPDGGAIGGGWSDPGPWLFQYNEKAIVAPGGQVGAWSLWLELPR